MPPKAAHESELLTVTDQCNSVREPSDYEVATCSAAHDRIKQSEWGEQLRHVRSPDGHIDALKTDSSIGTFKLLRPAARIAADEMLEKIGPPVDAVAISKCKFK